jgi:tetratricopeptide (TPR) repeat protein
MMGIFHFLKKSRDAASPEIVREALFDAVAADDDSVLRVLCEQHRDVILEYFPTWRTIPETVRDDADGIARYANGLIGVALAFEEQGEHQLLEMLQGMRDQSNPILRWEEDFTAAREAMSSGAYRRAVSLLENIATEMARLQGTAIDEYLPAVQGALGEAYYRLGRFDRAYESTFEAFTGCQDSGDLDGVICYCGNLAEICNRMGRREEHRRWLITTTNLMIRAGRTEDANELRVQFELEPVESLMAAAN